MGISSLIIYQIYYPCNCLMLYSIAVNRHIKLALDFGTTNSVVAIWDERSNSPRLVTVPGLSSGNPENPLPLIPSLLYVVDGRSADVIIGQSILENMLDRRKDGRLFRNFKREIMTRTVEDARLIDGIPWTDYEAGKCFLQGLVNALPYKPEELEQLVLTVPVAAFESYLTWLSDEVYDLPQDRIRMVDESTAAALGYSVTQPDSLVLVFDFGGGSLDLSLVKLPESRQNVGGFLKYLHGKSSGQFLAHVYSKGGITLGGSDIDRYLALESLKRVGIEPSKIADDIQPLQALCEGTKIRLSEHQNAQLKFNLQGKDYQVEFTRSDLENLLAEHGFYAEIRQLLDRIMHVAHRRGIFREDLRNVLMVGGTSLIPSIQALLREYFGENFVKVDKPFTAVAEGALLVAAGYGLEDYLAHSYGLRYLEIETGKQRYDEIIPMGSRYPIEKPIQIYIGAAHPQQLSIEFVLGEIEIDAIARVDLRYEEGQPVFIAYGASDLQKIIPLLPDDKSALRVPLDPPGVPGEKRLLAQFTVDAKRKLHLRVIDLIRNAEVIHDLSLINLEEGIAEGQASVSPGEMEITGYEPSILSENSGVQHRLSVRGLSKIIDMLPPQAISMAAAAEALKSDEFYVRYCTAELLSKRGDREARLLLEDFLKNGTPPQRAAIAHHLHRFSWFVAEPLIRRAIDDDDWRVREGAIYSLCKQGDKVAYKLLVEVLPGQSDVLKMAAAWRLSRNPDPDSLPVLAVTLKARDPQVRVQSLETIGAIQSVEAIPLVKIAISDPDIDVKYAATLSWIELQGSECFSEIANLILSTDGLTRRAILRGLFHATNYLFINIAESKAYQQVLRALEEALDDSLPETRLAAVMPLAWLRDDRAAAILEVGYRAEIDSHLKAQMVYLATSLMSPASERLLQNALVDPDLEIRKTAEQMMARRSQHE